MLPYNERFLDCWSFAWQRHYQQLLFHINTSKSCQIFLQNCVFAPTSLNIKAANSLQTAFAQVVPFFILFFFCCKALYHHSSSFVFGLCTQIRTIPRLSPHLGALCSTFRPRARKHTPSRRSLSTLISCKVGADSFKESPAATTTVRRRLFRLLVGISVTKIKLCSTHA